jgi:hypothetical protein
MELLRHVKMTLGPDRAYHLRLWDTGETKGNKSRLAYQLTGVAGETVFSGEQFCCSPSIAIDSDECLRILLSFLTIRPGDTDQEYFDDYTPSQLAFAEGDAEYLSLWADDEPFEEVEEN